MVAERGRERDFVTAGVALESVSDNVQLLAAPVAESLKHFEHRGGRTAWARVRDRLAALSIEGNTRVVKGDIAGSTRPRQRPGHWPACRTSHTRLAGSRRGSMLRTCRERMVYRTAGSSLRRRDQPAWWTRRTISMLVSDVNIQPNRTCITAIASGQSICMTMRPDPGSDRAL